MNFGVLLLIFCLFYTYTYSLPHITSDPQKKLFMCKCNVRFGLESHPGKYIMSKQGESPPQGPEMLFILVINDGGCVCFVHQEIGISESTLILTVYLIVSVTWYPWMFMLFVLSNL